MEQTITDNKKKFRLEIERLMKVTLKDIKSEILKKDLLTKLLEVLDILDRKE